MRKDVEAELKCLREMDIIEEVTGPTPWVSPAVVVPKKNKGVHICINRRKANEAIQRIKHPMDDLTADLNGSTVFNKLDLSNAYHQLELGEPSRHITTFATHAGLFRYKHLLFGVNTASELFQKAISDLLRGIPGVKNLSDDIIIYGCDQISHDSSLKSTLEHLQNAGARLNRRKCLFSVQVLTFFGHIFRENGVSPDPEKVSAIVKCTPSTSAGKVRLFLGMTQYVVRFIPHYATISEPLRQLTRKEAKWRWLEIEELALNKLKEALTGAGVMAYIDPNKDTNILVDMSPVGLGAVFTQNGKILCYTSRALTDEEQSYS